MFKINKMTKNLRNECFNKQMPVFIILFIAIFQSNRVLADEQKDIQIKYAVIGQNATISCSSTKPIPFVWSKDKANITEADKRFQFESDNSDIENIFYNLTIINVSANDTGNYSCKQMSTDENGNIKIITRRFQLNPIKLPRIVHHSPKIIRTKISQSVQLFCVIEAHPMDDFLSTIKWTKDGEIISNTKVNGKTQPKSKASDQLPASNRTRVEFISNARVNVSLDIIDVFKKDNGTYTCSVETLYNSHGDPANEELFKNHRKVSGVTSVLVLDVPQVSLDFVTAVGAKSIFVNWTANDGNEPIMKYFVQYMKEGSNTSTYYNHDIDGKNHSYVLDTFESNTSYQLKIAAKNKIGLGPTYSYPQWIRTLDKDPVFVPEIGVKGNTHSTITIGWQPPPADLLAFIHYYELIVEEAGENSTYKQQAIHPQNSRNLPYMFDELKTATDYKFRVRACSELTKLCGNWSSIVTGTTMDGLSSAPLNLSIECQYFNISGRTTITAQWKAPLKPNGKLVTYQVVLNGVATYRTEKRVMRNETYGPKVKSVSEATYKADYDNVPLNTNFTLQVAGVTRSKRPGDATSATCSMPRSVPEIGTTLWGPMRVGFDNWFLKVYLPRVSERNGPICGYRIYIIRLPQDSNEAGKHLLAIDQLDISTYNEVHAANNTKGGAYIAEILPAESYQTELLLGDGHTVKETLNSSIITAIRNKECKKLLNGFYVRHITPIKKQVETTEKPPEGDISNTNRGLDDLGPTKAPIVARHAHRLRRKRQQHPTNAIEIENEENGKATDMPITAARYVETIEINDNADFNIYDGPLNPLSNYTGFVEVIVNIDDNEKVMSAYSEYFDIQNGISNLESTGDAHLTQILNIAIQVLCGLILLVLVLLTALCMLHRFHTNKHSAQGHDVISLRDSLSRALCGGRNNQNHRHLIGTTSSKPTDIGPIHRSDLTQAYIQRHKDTDYGFLREYEMLPNRFTDRTTKNSDAKENSNKNRYPDIKAYDQTRVRLSERPANGMTTGSDYINANFVLGYKERKKFICAQGPMDSTINDFWRMIWEQHLELIVMLTNLEEYNKAKCAKYWPEQINDVTKFGEITVTFLKEQRYSDYLVREIKITRRNLYHNHCNSNNTSATNGGGNSSGDEEEERRITQYHYMVWKDFMAPELGVIRFIRQINEVYSVQRGPILVHCSAGVGRTGTLVALDSLMQQLEDENQVSIFNTVYDLRHQRNFLVQSLKQYIFLYRALLDVAQFGNTEIQSKDLNSTVEQLKYRPNDSKEQCKLEIEFEKIKSVLDESNKSCAVGNNEENRSKNRSEEVIPFDRNRVILAPVGREPSTYINATFVEGYDNSESFIVSQDPLEETIGDFWRMISEQSISTVVMISEIGEGPRKCPRYWADDEAEYEHILVKYLQSESCPYYTRREFNVTNFKMKDTIKVTQFQYNGWPTVEGEVPEVARGMIELVDQAMTYHNNNDAFEHTGPIVVHCSLGTERSSIFVALCILVQQLRLEKKVDCCTVVRKLRSQRSHFLDSYAQYEFIHRAIANYADLHKSELDKSPTPSGKTVLGYFVVNSLHQKP